MGSLRERCQSFTTSQNCVHMPPGGPMNPYFIMCREAFVKELEAMRNGAWPFLRMFLYPRRETPCQCYAGKHPGPLEAATTPLKSCSMRMARAGHPGRLPRMAPEAIQSPAPGAAREVACPWKPDTISRWRPCSRQKYATSVYQSASTLPISLYIQDMVSLRDFLN